MSPRTVFFDAPLTGLSDAKYTTAVSPLASADFGATIGWLGIFPISSSQRSKIQSLIKAAHDKGIKTRFYATPDTFTATMKAAWGELLNDGTDWLNADHLTTAKNYYNDWKAKQK
jgi:hypothetical protein